MTFYAVAGVIAAGTAILGLYMSRGPRSHSLSPAKLSRYRWATLVALGWTVIILIRLVTNTYR
jgi:hypothetical protein